MAEQKTCTVWVCVDCFMADMQGEEQYDHDDKLIETWTRIDADDSIEHTSPGLTAEEHLPECENFDEEGEYLGQYDEYCETVEFSWTPCDGCNSTLGGTRHAYTVWLK